MHLENFKSRLTFTQNLFYNNLTALSLLSIYPGYQIQMILWEGDDEFPPSSQILFSDNFPVSFAAEDMAEPFNRKRMVRIFA